MSIVSRAIKNITRRKTRAVMAIIAIGVATAIMISIPAGLNADQVAEEAMTQRLSTNYASMTAEIENTSTLIQVGNAGSGSGNYMSGGFGSNAGQSSYGQNSSTVNSTVQSEISSIDGVQAVVPYAVKTEGMPQRGSYTPGEFSRGQRSNYASLLANVYQVEGVNLSAQDINDYSVLPANITAGRALNAGENGSVLLSQNLTKFFNTQLGGTASIEGKTFTVVGIYGPTGSESNRTVYMSLSDAQNILGMGASVTYLDVYADNASLVNNLADSIQVLFPGVSVSTMSERLAQLNATEQNSVQALASANATVSQTKNTGLIEIIIAVAAAGMVIMFTMLYAVRERTKEIGVLKAMGFSKRAVVAQFMVEGVLVTAIAGVLGMAIGWAGTSALASILVPSGTTGASRFARAASSLNIQPDLSWMAFAFVLVVAIGAVGSLYPAWRASRTRPVEALKNE